MKLLICMITHNRLEWSKKTFETLKETIQVPHRIIIVDNASDDGTRSWVVSLMATNQIDGHILNNENHYPGKATNMGWSKGLELFGDETTHLMRSDNDMEYLDGWDIHAADAFRAFPELGQFSLMSEMQNHPPEEQHMHQRIVSRGGVSINSYLATVSGQAIFPKEIWTEHGIRWVEHDWTEQSQEAPRMSLAIRRAGLGICQSVPTLCKHLSLGAYDEYYEYHEKTFKRRGGVMWDRFQERIQAEREGKYENGQRVRK